MSFFLNRLQSSLSAPPSRRSKLLDARAAVRAFDSSEQKAVFERALFIATLKRNVDVDSTEFSGQEAGHSRQPSTVLVPALFYRPHQVILVLLQIGAERTLDLGSLVDGDLTFLASVRLRVKRASSDLLPYSKVGNRNLRNVI